MFSAVSNLGAGGTPDVVLSDISNGVLYGCFAIAGLFAGGVNNGAFLALSLRNRFKKNTHIVRVPVLGPRLTMFIGSLGYALYVGSLWWYVFLLPLQG